MPPDPSNKYSALAPRCRLAAIFISLAGAFTGSGADAYKWSVQYLIDNSRVVFGRPQKVSPRHNRGLAVSPDGKYLYAGYHHSFNNSGEVRRIAVDTADFDRATLAILPGVLGKAIATDDKGHVFIANGSEIVVCDATLQQRETVIPAGVCEGLATAREGKELVLYGSDREASTIRRWVLTESANGITGAAPSGFGGKGEFNVPGAVDLRGLEIDGKGRIWVADLKGNKLFRMDRDGKNLKSVQINSPIDIAFEGNRCFVTRYSERSITVLDDEMNVLGVLSVPWEELELSPMGNNRYGALSGIAALPGKGFFVSNEAGQTANQKSTYGRADDHSDFVDGKLYRDSFQDDNDPVLRATAVVAAP